MHWVDRGQEPDGLEQIWLHDTQRWIDYYRLGTRPKPRPRWTDFKSDLIEVFSELCAYCEERQRGEVDHFQPKSRFPELVYVWPNWVLACHDCNQAKLAKWPDEGYVDPCAVSISERPESFFDFDIVSGEIVPKEDLSSDSRSKAKTMIDDLRLNDVHHLTNRLEWLCMISERIPENTDDQSSAIRSICARLTSPTARLSSVARAWLVKRGYLPDC